MMSPPSSGWQRSSQACETQPRAGDVSLFSHAPVCDQWATLGTLRLEGSENEMNTPASWRKMEGYLQVVCAVLSGAGIIVVTFEENKGEPLAWNQILGQRLCSVDSLSSEGCPAPVVNRTEILRKHPNDLPLSSSPSCHAYNSLYFCHSAKQVPMTSGLVSI